MTAYVPPRFPSPQTPEQAAMIALLDRMIEVEQLLAVERKVRAVYETEVIERLDALAARIEKLEGKR